MIMKVVVVSSYTYRRSTVDKKQRSINAC